MKLHRDKHLREDQSMILLGDQSQAPIIGLTWDDGELGLHSVLDRDLEMS